MDETYEHRSERKFCYFIESYVDAGLTMRRWMLADGSWQEEEVGLRCPKARKCRAARRNCLAVDPKNGLDPFIPFRNLLADMW